MSDKNDPHENPDGFNPDDFDINELNKWASANDYDEASFLQKLKKFAGKIPFSRDLVALYYASKDPNVPIASKALILGGLAYFVSPIDAIPDVVVGLGYVDDATAVALILSILGSSITNQHKAAAEEFFDTTGTSDDGDDSGVFV
jgi:uncharacterized membrane protein YkvA (DUF1232 family)